MKIAWKRRRKLNQQFATKTAYRVTKLEQLSIFWLTLYNRDHQHHRAAH